LPVAGIAEWFATYVYLPQPRDRVVLETAIRDALAKPNPKFAYAAGSTKPWEIYRAPLAKGPERADAGSRPAGREVASAQLRAPLHRRPNRRRTQHSSTKTLVPFHRSLRG
jgi:hypothetical protein